VPKGEHKIPVKDYDFSKDLTVDELVGQMDAAWGFTAGKLATGVNIMEDMIKSKDCVKFLSFPADICATGTRGVIREMVKRKMCDIIITTCCTLEEAISWGKINSQSGTRAVCYCDATIALPLICHALAERVPEKRNGPDMSWIFKDMPKA